jgi:two-component system NtrC family sensor kinase
MRRRSTASKPVKRRGHQASEQKPHKTPTRRASTADLEEQLVQLRRERDEAVEQQTATSEVLRVISSSPGELQPVFNAILENAVQICQARFGILTLFDGNRIRHAASYNVPIAFKELRRREPVVPLEGSVSGRVHKAKDVVNLADVAAEGGHADTPLVKVAGARSVVGVPMLKEKKVIGAIVIYRTEIRPFSSKQIKLLTDFAAQAVIAIENARLLSELRESLEQQTATSEVLKVISSSPGDLEPVFQAMLENAVRICEAKLGVLFRHDGHGAFHASAWLGASPEYSEWLRQRGTSSPAIGTPLDRLLQTRKVVQVTDESAEPSPGGAARLGGARSLVAVPMFKEDELVGAIVIYRQEVRPFGDKQIELVKSFAAQAVIAIENTRLLNELRQRTDDLTESLEQQMATSEVLGVISSSAGELAPVFEVILENATRICEAKFGNLTLWEGDGFRAVAVHGEAAFAERRRQLTPSTSEVAICCSSDSVRSSVR